MMGWMVWCVISLAGLNGDEEISLDVGWIVMGADRVTGTRCV